MTTETERVERVESISLTDTAKMIREELKKAFPDSKFSVRSKSYSGGSSITVYYTDGPPSKEVSKITSQFSGASFDGMQDLKTYETREWNGKKVDFGADYVFVSRDYTDSKLHETIEAMLRARWTGADDYLYRQTAWEIINTMDLRWETPERAVNKYFEEYFTRTRR